MRPSDGKAPAPSTSSASARRSDARESDDREDDGPRDVFAVENAFEAFFVLVLLLFKFLFRACTRRCACCW
jgi:hypothetical protein